MAKATRSHKRVTHEELQQTYQALVDAQGPDGLTPAKGSIPQLLIALGIVKTPQRAEYVTRALIQLDLVERIYYSRKVKILPLYVLDRLYASKYPASKAEHEAQRDELEELSAKYARLKEESEAQARLITRLEHRLQKKRHKRSAGQTAPPDA